jgi:acid phosphatase (class A)
MRTPAFALASILVLLIAGASAAKPHGEGYLDDRSAPDTVRILPPAPATNSPEDRADQAIFKATRKLEDSPRWALAKSDSDEEAILETFSCATGAPLSADTAPRLAALLARVRVDEKRAVDAPKDLYGRKRPFITLAGPICAKRKETKSPDYPSGHATWSWAVGLILAELAPDRATDILVRARAFGEGRVVCGVHNASSIVEGRTTASALVAALHGDAAFRADLEAARAEMSSLRATSHAPDAGQCNAEAALIASHPW